MLKLGMGKVRKLLKKLEYGRKGKKEKKENELKKINEVIEVRTGYIIVRLRKKPKGDILKQK